MMVRLATGRRILTRGATVCAFALAAAAACTDTTSAVRAFPVIADVGTGAWQSVSVGDTHSCALKNTGAAYCWGDNRSGQLGIARFDTLCGAAPGYGCSLSPQPVQPGVAFASISAGADHTCAVTPSHEAFCWGDNSYNQVAAGASTSPTPIKIQSSLGWTQISAGFSHTCAVRTDGALYCWGSNDFGQLGNGSFLGSTGLARVAIAAAVASVSAGQERTCARTISGTVYCWGAIWTGVSNGLQMSHAQPTPQLVPNAPALANLSVGVFTTCGADVSGFVYCWEGNPNGEMGTGTTDGSTQPLRVASNLEFLQVSAGIVHTCGIVISGAGYCWGDDSFGQLGVSPSKLTERCSTSEGPCSTTPIPVFGAQQFNEISAGFGSHVCGVTVPGNLYCWGLGTSGQLGNGTETSAISVPVKVVEPATP